VNIDGRFIKWMTFICEVLHSRIQLSMVWHHSTYKVSCCLSL